MSFEPFDTEVIEQRLRDLEELEEIGGAADYAAVTEIRSFRTPSVYVVLAQEKDISQATALPGRRPSARQQAQVTVGIIMALRNYRDPQGEAVSKEAKKYIGQVREKLMGWTADQREFSALLWQQGDVLDYDDNTLLWADVFTTTRFIGGNA